MLEMERETQIRSSSETAVHEEAKGVSFEEISEENIQLLRHTGGSSECQEGEEEHHDNNSTRELQHPCHVCRVREGQFQPDSCRCRYSYCRKCAMKLGTGGKCISCGKFYGSIRSSR
jgi:hypothetical protein